MGDVIGLYVVVAGVGYEAARSALKKAKFDAGPSVPLTSVKEASVGGTSIFVGTPLLVVGRELLCRSETE